MERKRTLETGQKMLWDSGFGYDIVEFIEVAPIAGYLKCKMLTGYQKGTVGSFAEDELEDHSLEMENYLKLKYDF